MIRKILAYFRPVSAPDKLRALLADPRYRFRKLCTLAAAIGCSDMVTIGHLNAIGARPARGVAELWTLEPISEEATLRAMLADPRFRWRKWSTLFDAVALTGDEVDSILDRIGVIRRSGMVRLASRE